MSRIDPGIVGTKQSDKNPLSRSYNRRFHEAESVLRHYTRLYSAAIKTGNGNENKETGRRHPR